MKLTMDVSLKDEIEKEVIEKVKPVSEEEARLKELAIRNTQEIILSIDKDEVVRNKELLQPIESFGIDTMRNSASRTNSIKERTVFDMSRDGGQAEVLAKGLLDLQKELKRLDPSLFDFQKNSLLAKLIDPFKDYFAKYQKADAVIADIFVSLNNGKKMLEFDNITLAHEQQLQIDLTKKLKKEVLLISMMEEQIERWIEEAKARDEDPDKIRIITEEVHFPIRQRNMDLQQMIVVNQQSIIALEILRRNNRELIRGVERAKNVTMSALATAVVIAGALHDQKLVLDGIQKINEYTEIFIMLNAKLLKEFGAKIMDGSTKTNLSIDALKTALNDTIEALVSINEYRSKAMDDMQNTIVQLTELAEKGNEQIEKLDKGNKLSLQSR